MELASMDEARDTQKISAPPMMAATSRGVAPQMSDPLSFSRHVRGQEDLPLSYEFTHDPAMLHQYYLLRTQMFISVWGLNDFHAEEDKFDLSGEILVARRGNQVVGGGRMCLSFADSRGPLPMESEGFCLHTLLPELELHDKSYGEIGRFAVLPEFRTRELSFEMWRRFLVGGLKMGAEYGFWIAPALQARNNRSIANALNLPCTIRQDIEIPDREEYEGLRMYLGIIDLRPAKEKMLENGGHIELAQA